MASVRLESLGVYLPEKVVTTEEVMASCRRRPRLDLERITGIRERRVAVGEHAVDLAVGAARRALALSRYPASELDVVICAAISRHHRDDEFVLEPATAVLVAEAVGARGALVFDVVNACAGLLTGIYVLQGLILSGAARRGMVVSGEQNTPVLLTATRQIRHSLDGQLAALTLGDAGAAVILDVAEDGRHGFHCVDLVTGARHHRLCTSKPSPRGPGGMLVTRARGLQVVGNRHFPAYFKQALDATGWCLDDVDHVVPHQVSVRAIAKSSRALERHLSARLPEVVACVAERFGNTTTTSHWVALHELMREGRVAAGHHVVLVSGASGIVVGHATLTLDDLPVRYREQLEREGAGAVATAAPAGEPRVGARPAAPAVAPRARPAPRRCRIESLGVSLPRGRWRPRWGSLRHAVEAGRRCLAASQHARADVRVLVNAGVLRDEHVCEPAFACYIQDALGINVELQGRRTTSFDLLNGGCGVLNALHVLTSLEGTGAADAGLVVASEANSDRRPDPASTCPASGAAVLVDLSPRSRVGFGAFVFATRADLAGLCTTVVSLKEKRGRLLRRRCAELEDAWLDVAAEAVEEVLAADGLRRSDVEMVIPAQLSGSFLQHLPGVLGVPADRVLDLSGGLPDTLSTSVLLALHHVWTAGPPRPGSVALLLACGSGVTAGAATYHF